MSAKVTKTVRPRPPWTWTVRLNLGYFRRRSHI